MPGTQLLHSSFRSTAGFVPVAYHRSVQRLEDFCIRVWDGMASDFKVDGLVGQNVGSGGFCVCNLVWYAAVA